MTISHMDSKEILAELQRRAEIVQAYLDGKQIQSRTIQEASWQDTSLGHEPCWLWDSIDYRIAPQPVTIYLNIYTSRDSVSNGYRVVTHTKKEYAEAGAKQAKNYGLVAAAIPLTFTEETFQ